MTFTDLEQWTLRAARPGEGQRLYDITKASVAGLASGHYSPQQINGWMNGRSHEDYERIILRGGTFVIESRGSVGGFVDAIAGEITRLFVMPDIAGHGLGTRLLQQGLQSANQNHNGPIRLEATLNAVGFYERHGFEAVQHQFFSQASSSERLVVVLMER